MTKCAASLFAVAVGRTLFGATFRGGSLRKRVTKIAWQYGNCNCNQADGGWKRRESALFHLNEREMIEAVMRFRLGAHKLAISEGRFREDLYYRLCVVTIAVPALKERGSDISLLARTFLMKFAEGGKKPLKGFQTFPNEARFQKSCWPLAYAIFARFISSPIASFTSWPEIRSMSCWWRMADET